MRKCAICQSSEVYEDSPILVMGAYGVPKCLCDTCSKDMECATGGREYAEVEAAIERLGARLKDGKADSQALEVASALLTSAAERCAAIKRGEYDFSLDESEPEGEDELSDIPEELRETEEDKELDRQDAEKQEKFNEFMDYVNIGALVGVGIAAVYILLKTFLF